MAPLLYLVHNQSSGGAKDDFQECRKTFNT